MKNVIVPLNAFERIEVLENGQASYVRLIAESAAFGIEIRRELLLVPIQNQQLEQIRDEINTYGLFTVYSAPIELWNEDYQLNTEGLTKIFQEGISIGASWIKVSLGHFGKEESDMIELNHFLNQHPEIQLLVENDQTLYGGNISNLKAFFERAVELHVPVKMTFDAGNWDYTGQDVQEALHMLAPYVIYLHLKQVEEQNSELVTVPLEKEGNNSWKKVMDHFPEEMVKGLEFPIEPKEKTREYIGLVTELTRNREAFSCSN